MNTPHSAMRRSVPRLVTVLGMLAICLGATSKSCKLIQDNIDDRGKQSFVTALTLQDASGTGTNTFKLGNQIQLVMTVRNELKTSATVEFTTGRTFDFVVVRQGTADVVWKWSDGQTFSQTKTQLQFAAEETKTFTRTWNQNGAGGSPVRTGTYEARGVLVYDGFDTDPLKTNQMGSPLVRFTIIQ